MRVKVADVRIAAELKQAELAEKVGISRAYLAQIESGVRKLTIENQSRIAEALGVDPKELVDFDAPGKDEEELLIEAFRSMTKDQRAAWISMARVFLGIRV